MGEHLAKGTQSWGNIWLREHRVEGNITLKEHSIGGTSGLGNTEFGKHQAEGTQSWRETSG